MQDDLRLEITDVSVEADEELVRKSLREFNRVRGGMSEVRTLNVIVRDGAGRIVGGLLAGTWGEFCHIYILWVAEEHRRSGLGSRMMREAEREARARGCRRFFLDTFSFQAPQFYPKLGYEPVYTCQEYPHGVFKRYFVKTVER